MEEQSKLNIPRMNLPTGGGAIKGIGETFQPNPFTGSASFAIPLPVSPCRDFSPTLSLQYSSGYGNGSFGLGFTVDVLSIARRTDKGIPRYDDQDTFILSSAGILVPKLEKQGDQWLPVIRQENKDGIAFAVQNYLPRVEGSFARIEHWVSTEGKINYWQIITSGNVTHILGATTAAQIYDPDNPAHIFAWLVENSFDATGNEILYSYKADAAQKYLSKIFYGNLVSLPQNYSTSITAEKSRVFTLIFDYGEYDINNPNAPSGAWLERPDPFSNYCSGFEIRTKRLCHNIIMTQQFAELGVVPQWVKVLHLEYQEETSVKLSLVKKVSIRGYQCDVTTGEYTTQTLPATELAYTAFNPQDQSFKPLLIQTNSDKTSSQLPAAIEQGAYNLVDLYGEGLPGILYSDATVTEYWQPLGEGQLASAVAPTQFPIERNLATAEHVLMDLAGTGKPDWVINAPPRGGYYQSNPDKTWTAYTDFIRYPQDFANPARILVDLNGNGLNDILICENETLKIYPSLGLNGFGSAYRTACLIDYPADFPITVSSMQQFIGFLSIVGDGLQHRVCIRNGSVEYWPNLGYGKFGKKITFENAPLFDDKNAFTLSRLSFADLDGSGTTDLIYFFENEIHLYLNQNGNRFSDRIIISLDKLQKKFDNLTQINWGDILGTGAATLILTNHSAQITHQYYDFSGGTKPYLLAKITNNQGATTTYTYRSSTAYYLDDLKAGKPWKTQLPFPVQVIASTTVHEAVMNSITQTHYAYHDGYYDPQERSFNGFGYVETWSNDILEVVTFPVYTRNWYHTGASIAPEILSRQYASDYFAGDPDALTLADSNISNDINLLPLENVAACEALKGLLLRQEVYWLDGSPQEKNPYTMQEINYTTRLLQPQANNQYPVYFPYQREAISYRYERIVNDPQVVQNFTLEVDDYGNVLRSCTVNYPRRSKDQEIYPQQTEIKATAALTRFCALNSNFYLPNISYEAMSFELGGLNLNGQLYFDFDTIQAQVDTALLNKVPFNQSLPADTLAARWLSWQQNYYCSQNLSLPLGKISAQVLLHHSEVAVFTPDFIQGLIAERMTVDGLVASLIGEGGYVLHDGLWWNTGLIADYYSVDKYYLPKSYTDNLGGKTEIDYDTYCLAPQTIKTKVSDTEINIATAYLDYQTLQPCRMIDINGNTQEALFDPLGRVLITSIYGYEKNEFIGDKPLNEYKINPTVDFDAVLRDPHAYLQGAASYFYYEDIAWQEGKPLRSLSVLRDTYASALPTDKKTAVQFQIAYSDGLGRVIETKTNRYAWQSYAQVSDEQSWIASGRHVLNSAGNPVKGYAPFFTGLAYEPQAQLLNAGVTAVTYYDGLQRVIKVSTPMGTFKEAFFSKTIYETWQTITCDADDTILDSPYYQANISNTDPAFADELDALKKAAVFASTPNIQLLDNMGYVFQQVGRLIDSADVIVEQILVTYYQVDISGKLLTSSDPRLYEKGINNFVYVYDMTGTPLLVKSIDAGLGLTLLNSFGNPMRSWDAKNQQLKTSYDLLQRPLKIELFQPPVLGNPIVGPLLVEKFVYGETQANSQAYNLRGQLVEHYDQAGRVSAQAYTMQGQLQQSSRQVRAEYQKVQIDWNEEVLLAPEIYAITTTYDALSRVLTEIKPDGSVSQPHYHPNGLLKGITLDLPTADAAMISKTFIKHIDYNAQGQDLQIQYDNQTITTKTYDVQTFRLQTLVTTRNDMQKLQDLVYTYDPVGNITRLWDNSYEAVFTNQTKVEPLLDYTYDSFYRLKIAIGREHAALRKESYKYGFKQTKFITSDQPNLNDLTRLSMYARHYKYDMGDNLIQIQHSAPSPSESWTTDMVPSETSNHAVLKEMVEDGSKKPADYFDANGNMIKFENLRELGWTYQNQLAFTFNIVRDAQNPDGVYYIYDSSGKRVRKVSERLLQDGNSTEIEEKIYLGDYEIKRVYVRNNQDNTQTMILDRQCQRVMGNDGCAAISYYWKQDDREREAKTGQRSYRYQLTNLLGSSAMEVNENAELISYEEYFPFGSSSFIAGNNKKEVELKDYRYTGKECDDITGLYYDNARYLAPWIGRWISADPTGPVNGLNIYTYVGNNPVNANDPTGMMKIEVLTEKAKFIDVEVEDKLPAGQEYNGRLAIDKGVSVPDYRRIPVSHKITRNYRLKRRDFLKGRAKKSSPADSTSYLNMANAYGDELGNEILEKNLVNIPKDAKRLTFNFEFSSAEFVNKLFYENLGNYQKNPENMAEDMEFNMTKELISKKVDKDELNKIFQDQGLVKNMKSIILSHAKFAFSPKQGDLRSHIFNVLLNKVGKKNANQIKTKSIKIMTPWFFKTGRARGRQTIVALTRNKVFRAHQYKLFNV